MANKFTSASRLPQARSGPFDLVAIDLDGTLLNSDNKLTPTAIRTIQEVSARGVSVILASARPPRTVRAFYEQLNLQTPQINYNGALIHDPPANEHLYHQPLRGNLVRDIVAAARKIDPQVCVSIETLDRWFADRIDPTLMTQTALLVEPDVLGSLDAAFIEPVTKLMLLAPTERLAILHKAIHREFATRIKILLSDEHLMQIIHPSVDKAHALAWIVKREMIPAQRIMAIGDAPNDEGMLRYAGLGVAVGNGWEQTLQAADVVVPSNDDDGVAFALRKYLLDKSN